MQALYQVSLALQSAADMCLLSTLSSTKHLALRFGTRRYP